MLQPLRESLERLFNNLIRKIKNNTSCQAIQKKIFRLKSSTQMVKIANESLEEIAEKGIPFEEMNIILDKFIRANEVSESFKYLCTCKSENKILARRPIGEKSETKPVEVTEYYHYSIQNMSKVHSFCEQHRSWMFRNQLVTLAANRRLFN